MPNYSIHFQLLLPRAKLLRIDILPFLALYAALATALYQYYDDPNLNLYLRLAIIATAFLQSTSHHTQVSPTSSDTGPNIPNHLSNTDHCQAPSAPILTTQATCIFGRAERARRRSTASAIYISKS